MTHNAESADIKGFEVIFMAGEIAVKVKPTESNTYTPTVAQLRLLQVLLDPANMGKSITDKCGIAQIDRTTYYDAMAKSDFVALIQKTSIDFIKHHVGDIIGASIKCAMEDRYKGHADRKMLLEMCGIYKAQQDININNTLTVQAIIAKLPQADLQTVIQSYVQQHPEILAIPASTAPDDPLDNAITGNSVSNCNDDCVPDDGQKPGNA